ncbi:DNA-3-methyladenine glycosylase 2 family protein [Devosia sp.]|uniref:DNA-3-methyladenine glycosylase family protein n=1 Tax=Devosia sp. TaxID=1871048 RepID=UPI0032655C8D
MSGQSPTIRLDTLAAVEAHLDQLAIIDPRLVSVRAATGPVTPRINEPGFIGLAKVICGQQLSVASARAIWARYEALEGALDPVSYLNLDEAAVRGVGFSAGKYRTVKAIAEAVAAGALDFAHVETLQADQAVKYLTAHKGIGPWTAEVYLMFCAGHPDVFPAGDLALLKAVHWGLHLNERPSINQMVDIAKTWAPYRSSAALLFWRYFAVIKERDGIV